MSLSMQIEARRDYLALLISGTFDLDRANELTPGILDACAANAASRLLVDVRAVHGTMSIAERFIFVEAFVRNYKKRRVAGTIKHVQFAWVGTYPMVDPHRFGEKVARDMGLHVKVTTSMEEALVWLGVNPPAPAQKLVVKRPSARSR